MRAPVHASAFLLPLYEGKRGASSVARVRVRARNKRTRTARSVTARAACAARNAYRAANRRAARNLYMIPSLFRAAMMAETCARRGRAAVSAQPYAIQSATGTRTTEDTAPRAQRNPYGTE